MGDEKKEDLKEMRIPKGCRMNDEGKIECPDSASRELKPESEKGAFFTNSKVSMKNMKCKEDRRTGKQSCVGEFEIDNPPEF